MASILCKQNFSVKKSQCVTISSLISCLHLLHVQLLYICAAPPGTSSNLDQYSTLELSIQHKSLSVLLCQAKWASQHFRAFQHALPTPWGSCKSSRQHIVIPLSLILVRHICHAATFSLSLRFALVWHILVVHFLYMPSSPRCHSSSQPVRPIKLVFTGSRDCVPVSSRATQTLHPHE